MEKKVSTLNPRTPKASAGSGEEQPAKALPLKGWRAASAESKPAPASHFGCVDWYMYEHADAMADKAQRHPGR